jgi:hypothetical protein
MPNLTTNYGFKKPLGTESADINVLNSNFDSIDAALAPTISQTTAPTSSSTQGKISVIVGWIVNRIKAITGKANWWEAPSVTLEQVSAHIGSGTHPNATQSAAGFMSASDKLKLDNATAENVASRLAIRDSNGRIRVASPSSSYDAANKMYIDNNFVNKSLSTTMSAMLTAYSNSNYSTRQVRNIVIWSSGGVAPSTSNGDIIIKTF